MQENKKILLLTPSDSAKGGIVNYFQVLNGKFKLPVEYFIRGARNWPNRDGKLKEIKRAWIDLQKFKKRIRKGDVSLIQTSTSLGSFAVIRDGFFLNAAKKKKISAIAFFRGWDEDFEKKIKGWKLFLFKKYYFSAEAFIVLSRKIEEKLRNWGYTGNVYTETTVVDQNILATAPIEYLEYKISAIDQIPSNLLFLARTEGSKGLFECIEAFRLLKLKYPTLKLTISGDGFGKSLAIEMVKDYNLTSDVIFTGFINGKDKARVFIESHIYIFPSYTEGMPNSVLEAMAFGLPVVTTSVGGLSDFFIENKHGKYIDIKDFNQIAEKTESLLKDKELYKKIALHNFIYARERFTSDIVINRLEKIYSHYIR